MSANRVRQAGWTDLYCASGGEEPFTSFGLNAADKLFTQIELEELVLLVRKLTT